MIKTKKGTITFPYQLFGYVGKATQEEAERLSDGLQQRGLVVFVPLADISQFDIDRHVVKKEDVEVY